MAQALKRGSVLTGLVVIGALVAGGREARAIVVRGGTATSITINGTLLQDPGDPPYTYQFSVFTNGTITNGVFSITNLVGVDSGSITPGGAAYPVTTTDGFGQTWTPTIPTTVPGSGSDPSSAGFYDTSTITWTFAGTLTGTTSSNYLLGTFDVTTNSNYDNDFASGYPSLFFNSNQYSYQINSNPLVTELRGFWRGSDRVRGPGTVDGDLFASGHCLSVGHLARQATPAAKARTASGLIDPRRT